MDAEQLARRAAFVHACDNDDAGTVGRLLEAHGDLDGSATSGHTADIGWGAEAVCVLSAAAQRGSLAVVQALVSSGRAGGGLDETEATALYHACANGHAECAVVLVGAPGADPDHGCAAVDGCDYGDTPLIGAAQRGHRACVELLLAARADVNVAGYEDRTAFMRALMRGHTADHAMSLAATACARLLVPTDAAGAAAECAFGCRPLAYAAACGDPFSTKALLAVGGVDVNHCSSDAALRAADDRGFDPEDGDAYDHHNTALALAANGRHLECTKALLAADGIDVNRGFGGGNHGHEPIIIAKGADCVRAIALAKGVRINVGDIEDRCCTALHNACNSLEVAEAEVLLVAGACRFQEDTEGDTALDWARQSHDGIVHAVSVLPTPCWHSAQRCRAGAIPRHRGTVWMLHGASFASTRVYHVVSHWSFAETKRPHHAPHVRRRRG